MIAIIILAAGASRRLGKPKQLLVFEGKTLIQNSIDSALSSKIGPVFLVVGSNAQEIIGATNVTGIHVLTNSKWEHGIGSSISVGICALKDHPEIDRAIIVLCDQPYVNTSIIAKLVDASARDKNLIIASQYNGATGCPALFPKRFFQDLIALSGNQGAKRIMMNNKENLHLVDFAKGIIDIDTPQDYNKLIAGK